VTRIKIKKVFGGSLKADFSFLYIFGNARKSEFTAKDLLKGKPKTSSPNIIL